MPPTPDPEFDCTACGACCTAEAHGTNPFVTLLGDDDLRFAPAELDPDSAGCSFLATTPHAPGETRCLFLSGTLGGACACSAYERRPQVCRDFTAGTPECRAARARRFGPAVGPGWAGQTKQA